MAWRIEFSDVHELDGTYVAIRAWDGCHRILARVRATLLERHFGVWGLSNWRNAISGKPWPEIRAIMERKIGLGMFLSRTDGWIDLELTTDDIETIYPESMLPPQIEGSFQWLAT